MMNVRRVILVLFCLLCICTMNSTATEPVISNSGAVDYVETFAHLYGYVRFFHPSDEASLIDWSNFAVYGVKQVVGAKNPEELKKILLDLFLPIAPTLQLVPIQNLPQFSEPPLSLTPTGIDVTTLKKVSWQHNGLWLGPESNMYRSIRLNRQSTIPLNNDLAYALKKLDAASYQKKEFRLSAAVKTELGSVQLWFKVLLANGNQGFFSKMNQSPIESPNWKEFEIKGEINEGAATMYIGAILNGKGYVLLDNFKFYIKEGQQWVEIPLENAGFEGDEAGTASPQQWLVSGDGYEFKVADSTTGSTGKYLIIKSLTERLPSRLFEQEPKMGECIRKDIGNGLACVLPLVLYDVEGHTFPKADQAAFQALDTAVKDQGVAAPTAVNLEVRWAGIVVLWNVLQHFYPYFNVVDANWPKQLNVFLEKSLTDKDEKEFLVTLQKLTVLLEDGHSTVYNPQFPRPFYLPLAMNWIENQVVVIYSQDSQFLPGDVVLEVDHRPAAELMAEVEAVISGSPQWKKTKAFWRFATGEKDSRALIKIKRGEQILEFSALRNLKWLAPSPDKKAFYPVKEGIYYIDFSRVTDKEFEEYQDKLMTAQGIIIDARGYVEFKTAWLLGHFSDVPLDSCTWNCPEVIYPDQEKVIYKDRHWSVPTVAPRIKAPLVFLTNSRAISASETFMCLVRDYRLGEIVGQATAGTNGNVNYVSLPGKYTVLWTGLRVVNQDGSCFHLTGVLPTVPMEQTVQGVRDGKDELLLKAVEILEKRK